MDRPEGSSHYRCARHGTEHVSLSLTIAKRVRKMKQKPRVPEESRKRPSQTGVYHSLLPNDGSEGRRMQTCEPSVKRTSGRFTERASNPKLAKPKELSVISVNRGGGCAGEVLYLTRGEPLRWRSDKTDRVSQSEAGRWSDAFRAVRRTHSSRKTVCRGRTWRHAQRVKQIESTTRLASGRQRRRGEHRKATTTMNSRSVEVPKKLQLRKVDADVLRETASVSKAIDHGTQTQKAAWNS